MDDLTEFLDRNGIRDDYGKKFEGFHSRQAYLINVPYTEKELSIEDKKKYFDLGTVDRLQLIELCNGRSMD
jgi:hypothetical protein